MFDVNLRADQGTINKQLLAAVEIVQTNVDNIPPSDGGGGGGAGATSWGDITGTLSSQTDLQTALNAKASSSHTHTIGNVTGLTAALAAKQDTLVSGINIKTVNGVSVLGSGDVPITGSTTVKTTSVTLPSGRGVIEHIETVTDAEVTATSKINLTLGTFADDDENDPEFLDIASMSAKPSTGSFDVVMAFAIETSGIIKLNYIVGA